jgi:hypothetical protein
MTPVWQTATLGVAALAMASATIAMARRSARAKAGSEALARRLDDLSLRLRAVEAALGPRSAPEAAGKGRPARLRRRVDAASTTAVAGPTLIAVPSLAAIGSEAVAHEASAGLGRRFGPIWELADAGEPAEAIARATGHPIGQVELILALRRQADASKAGEAVRHG